MVCFDLEKSVVAGARAVPVSDILSGFLLYFGFLIVATNIEIHLVLIVVAIVVVPV